VLAPFDPLLEHADATTTSRIVAHAIQAPSR
jgi:hypothetical protein